MIGSRIYIAAGKTFWEGDGETFRSGYHMLYCADEDEMINSGYISGVLQKIEEKISKWENPYWILYIIDDLSTQKYFVFQQNRKRPKFIKGLKEGRGYIWKMKVELNEKYNSNELRIEGCRLLLKTSEVNIENKYKNHE